MKKKNNRIIPVGDIEKTLFDQGLFYIVGVDEVGRGALAGPIVGCALAASPAVLDDLIRFGVCDSKILHEGKREELYEGITSIRGLFWKTTFMSANQIDSNGLSFANNYVLEKSVVQLQEEGFCDVRHILVDGFYINNISIKQDKIIKGDQKSVVIAAASILAKVTRDRYMKELALIHPEYGFETNKGYGTAFHLDALRSYGYSPEHRRSFSPVAQIKINNEQKG